MQLKGPVPTVQKTYWLEHAWLGDLVEPGVALGVTADGRIAEVRTGAAAPPPGARCCAASPSRAWPTRTPTPSTGRCAPPSRSARGRSGPGARSCTASPRTSTPESYFDLARAVYAEMALAGITNVGEFHYVHHAPGGTPYADPNAMGEALIEAAAAAGIRITLLDTAYLAAGFGEAPNAHQRRFSDGTAEAWAERVSALKPREHALIGAAVHSVRAVPAGQLATVAAWAQERRAPLHVHLSEQTAENDACLAAHGRTPTQLLADHGVLGPHTTGVHNTHLTDEDIALLGGTTTGTCMCPTTERDLADGIGPAGRLQRAGSPLSLGSDSHAVIDLLEEARAMELNERLRSRTRGHWTANACWRPPPPTATPRWAARTRAGWRPGPSRTSRPSRWTPSARPGRCRGSVRRRRSSRPRPPTSATRWWAAATWSATASTPWSATSRGPCPKRSPPSGADAGKRTFREEP